MEMTQVLDKAKKQLADVTGLKIESITRVIKDNGGWRIGVDLLEMSRIPPATDVLGDYEVLLGEDGSMLRFERKRTRLRADPMEVEEEE